MKTRLLIAAFQLFSFSAFHAHAQFATTVVTNMQIAGATITNATTYTYAGTNLVDVSRYHNIGWQLSFAGSALSTNTVTLTFKRSADGTNYETTPLYAWAVTALGTNPVVLITNFPTAPAIFWQPYQITSAVTNDLTNAILFGIKRSAIVD
jgi:hypothetical protein